MLGLSEEDLSYIIMQLQNFAEIEKAVVFGSRALGTQKKASDIDIAIFGEKINFDIVSKLHESLESVGPLPYLIDVLHFESLSHPDLMNHIAEKGKVIYQKRLSNSGS